MDGVTRDVRALYTEYPFPSEVYEYNNELGLEVFRYFMELAQQTGLDLLSKGTILDAGCGTGQNAVSLARVLPAAKVLGVDMTEASLERARAYAEQSQARNVQFACANLLELDLERTFDAIFCIGVLHHLSDPVQGIQRLRAHMAPTSKLVMWLYGKHGRARLHLNQALLRLLLKDVTQLSEKVQLTKELLRNARDEHMQCYFSVPEPALESDWQAAKQWILGKDEWLVDQFLHVNERAVDMSDILGYLDAADLRLDKWVGCPTDARALLGSDAMYERFTQLTAREQALALDLLLKPNVYVVIAGAKQAAVPHPYK